MTNVSVFESLSAHIRKHLEDHDLCMAEVCRLFFGFDEGPGLDICKLVLFIVYRGATCRLSSDDETRLC